MKKLQHEGFFHEGCYECGRRRECELYPVPNTDTIQPICEECITYFKSVRNLK